MEEQLGRVTRDLEQLRKVVKGLLEREGPRVTSAVPVSKVDHKYIKEKALSADKIKQIVAGILTLVVVVIPGSSDIINAAGGQAEILAAVIAVYTVVHGVVDYLHNKTTGG